MLASRLYRSALNFIVDTEQARWLISHAVYVQGKQVSYQPVISEGAPMDRKISRMYVQHATRAGTYET